MWSGAAQQGCKSPGEGSLVHRYLVYNLSFSVPPWPDMVCPIISLFPFPSYSGPGTVQGLLWESSLPAVYHRTNKTVQQVVKIFLVKSSTTYLVLAPWVLSSEMHPASARRCWRDGR